jgi:hypothetical protein
MNIQTATPAEIDTELAQVEEKLYDAIARQAQQQDNVREIEEALKAKAEGRPTRLSYLRDGDLDRARASLRSLQDKVDALVAQAAPFRAEYTRRGGWTRAFLVFDGHIHRSVNCTTCYDTTRFGWLPAMSGLTEEEIVAAAGADACTVCYPLAPVETAGPRTVLHHTEQAAQAAREEREAKRQAAAAKKAANAIEPAIRTEWDKIDTVYKAKMFLTDSQESPEHPWYPADVVNQVAEALAAKLGTTAQAQIEAAQKRAANR